LLIEVISIDDKIAIMPISTTDPAPIVLRLPGSRVYLRPPRKGDGAAFLAASQASRRLHGAWVRPPMTAARFVAYVERYGEASIRNPTTATNAGLLVFRIEDDALAGVFNFSEIVRGAFHSAYLGYYAFAPHAGNGCMSDGLAVALAFAFRTLKLHRVEVNARPENARSLALVRRAGFVREGYSRRYLKIAGRWRDHIRLALLVEDWRTRRQEAR
jgi:[ribosomal protein S5]-alanine N-acetyltransferase